MRSTQTAAKENDMKAIRNALVALVLSGGWMSCAQAHVFVGFGVGVAAAPVALVPAVPVAPVYAAPPPVYYAPPPPAPPVYAAPVVSYWQPAYYPAYSWRYGYGYWRR
jgi:hypothetical protein